MKCKKCKKRIEYLKDMGSNNMCRSCYNEYMKQYQRKQRELLDDVPILRSRNGILSAYCPKTGDRLW